MGVETGNEAAATSLKGPKDFLFLFPLHSYASPSKKVKAFPWFVYFILSNQTSAYKSPFISCPSSSVYKRGDSCQPIFKTSGFEGLSLVEPKSMLTNVGLIGRLEWVSSYSRKQCRNLFKKVRGAVKRAVKNGDKKQFNFQYDSSSYALNFDDSCCHLGRVECGIKPAKYQHCSNTPIWVCVLWVES